MKIISRISFGLAPLLIFAGIILPTWARDHHRPALISWAQVLVLSGLCLPVITMLIGQYMHKRIKDREPDDLP